jgi:hypothetical protein
MITVRLVRALGPDRSVDGLDPAELRAWLVELRTTLASVSVAGYVRTLRGARQLAGGGRRSGAGRAAQPPWPPVPHKVISR